MKELTLFKEQIETLLKIAEWNPTIIELKEIARQFAKKSPNKSADAYEIVYSASPKVRYILNEGIDNSDLRTLLAKAIALAKEIEAKKN